MNEFNIFIFTWFLCSKILRTSSLTYVNTNEVKWKLRNGNGSCRVAAEVPGGVYGSLMDEGVLKKGDFYFRYNDLNYRYVSYENWTYSAYFEVPEMLFSEDRVALEFDGLDSIASIKLNRIKIGSTDNMFVKYSFDVKQFLKKKNRQSLEIAIQSPVEWSQKAYEKQLKDYLVPPKCVDPAYKGECHVNHIRKMQSSFSWDWGPAFPNLGIWRPWRMVGWSTLKVETILFSAEPLSELPRPPDRNSLIAWKVNLKITFESAILHKVVQGNLLVQLHGNSYLNKSISVIPDQYSLTFEENFDIPEGIVELWWPNGYGSQPLYNLSIKWSSHHTNETSEKKIKIGFRTVELDQSFVDTEDEKLGRYFRFRINNVTMFLKGSNWIPSHVLSERMNTTYTKRLLMDAAKTHQNCLRVWGGGIYESNEFYEIADSLGILIWQEFMFACNMYPSAPEFLKSVALEVETQIHRLQHHPSIMLWAANNENEAALRENWYGTRLDFEVYKRDYIKLYVTTIRNLTLKTDSSRPFIVSSPSNGVESEQEGFVALHPYDNKYGDVHFYDYFHNGWDWEIYPRTRLASEYGYQSWPSFRTLKSVTIATDWHMMSAMMKHRQHHPVGNLQLLLQLLNHFEVSQLFNGNNKSFEYYLYLTQVHQAMAVKIETEFYRRDISDITKHGEGYTSGALYWQLNDIWQGASWSSIEFGGRWKMLHYFACQFFRPFLLSPWLEGNQVKVTLVNDLLEDIEELSLSVKILSYLQMNPLSIHQRNISTIEAQKAVLAVELDLQKDLNLNDVCQVLFYDPRNVCFLTFELRGNKKVTDQSAFLLLGEPKNALLKKAHVEILRVTSIARAKFKLTLITDAIALFVWLETDIEGVFSDNGFLMSNETQDVFFEPLTRTSLQDLKDNIQITTLSDTLEILHENEIRNNFLWPQL